MSEEETRVTTTVYVTRLNGPTPRWSVRVRYAGTPPTSLVSTPSREEAYRMCRSYGARYGWEVADDAQ